VGVGEIGGGDLSRAKVKEWRYQKLVFDACAWPRLIHHFKIEFCVDSKVPMWSLCLQLNPFIGWSDQCGHETVNRTAVGTVTHCSANDEILYLHTFAVIGDGQSRLEKWGICRMVIHTRST
jgi:hypothetical protein